MATLIDEPLVAPVSPGAALARLAQVSGALERLSPLPDALRATLPTLRTDRDSLLDALAAGDRAALAAALATAQETLRGVYGTCATDSNLCAALDFPRPDSSGVQAVDAATVLATFAKPVRQVLTTLWFQDAPGAVAYWLIEERTLRGETLTDYLLESVAPCFRSVRLPVGPHVFRIESRDTSGATVSAPFAIEVPAL